jgi:hypothetical protein
MKEKFSDDTLCARILRKGGTNPKPQFNHKPHLDCTKNPLESKEQGRYGSPIFFYQIDTKTGQAKLTLFASTKLLDGSVSKGFKPAAGGVEKRRRQRPRGRGQDGGEACPRRWLPRRPGGSRGGGGSWAASGLRVCTSMASNIVTVAVASVCLSADSVAKVKSMTNERYRRGPCSGYWRRSQCYKNKSCQLRKLHDKTN